MGFPDAERLVKRLVAQGLTLSFVPDAEQRLDVRFLEERLQPVVKLHATQVSYRCRAS